MPYKADTAQKAIIDALRASGCSVCIISGANGQSGVPDLLVGRWPTNFLLEVKTPKAKGRSEGQLSNLQKAWHANWRGQVAVVRTVDEALAAVGLL